MKKFLKIFLVFLVLFTLAACNTNANEKLLKVNENDRVELTTEEVTSELEGVSLDNQVLKVALELEVETEGVELEGNATLHVSSNGAIAEIKLNGALEEGNLDVDAKIYANNQGAFLNGKVEFSMGQGMTMTINGKYKVSDVFEDFTGTGLDDILGELDFNELFNDPTFLTLVAEYEGLTFYRNGDTFQMRLLINNALLVSNKTLLESLFGEMDLEAVEDMELELVVAVKDKKLAAVSLRIEAETPDMKLKVELTATAVNKMPAFPNDLDTYEEWDASGFAN